MATASVVGAAWPRARPRLPAELGRAATLVARSTAGIGLAEFSRDDRRLADTAGAQLYVADVP
jgi:hypothetical protein